MYCPDCGAGARDDANYCLSCGYDLTDVPGSGIGAQGPADRPHVQEAEGPGGQPTTPVTLRPDGTSVSPIEIVQRPDIGARRVDLRECPSCGAPNATDRVMCGRCGADLSTGATGAVPRAARQDASATEASRSEEKRSMARRSRPGRGTITALIVVLGALLGVGLGWAVVSGPLASEEPPGTPATPTFDPQVYAVAPQRLDVATVEASSTQPQQGENRYDAPMLFDRDLTTAWNSQGVTSEVDVGELLRFNLTGPAWVSQILVGNGYQKDDERYFGNARVRRARLEFDDGEMFAVMLLDQMGMQSIDLPEPVLTRRVTLRILETYAGTTYADVALAEIEIHGHPATGPDAEFTAPARS
ncbi:MAG: zinc ribbon domain-containing protein [Actinobacteria bacterium]|nr:zinc ribbon domain-containing protein [Actinomycetota bacterium]